MRGWLDRALRPAWPAERLAIMRLLLGAYGVLFLLIRSRHFMSYAHYGPEHFRPVGVVSLLEQPLPTLAAQFLVLLTILAAVAFWLGWRFRVTAPLYAALLLWVETYSNSFGFIMHTDNLFVLYVLVMSLTPAAAVYSLDHRRTPQHERDATLPSGRYGWGLRLMCVLCVAGYLLAGYAKLRHSGLDFFDEVTLRNYVAYDNVRKIELGSVHSPLGAWLLPYEGAFQFLGALSMVLELGAPLALLHRRLALTWCVLVFGFHWGVLALMAIGFPFQLTGLAFAPFFAVEALGARPRVARLLRRLSPPPPAEP